MADESTRWEQKGGKKVAVSLAEAPIPSGDAQRSDSQQESLPADLTGDATPGQRKREEKKNYIVPLYRVDSAHSSMVTCSHCKLC